MVIEGPPVRRPLPWPYPRWSIPPFCCPLMPPMPMMTSWGPSRYTCSSRQSHWTLANLPWEDEWPKNERRVLVNKRPRVHCHSQTESKEVFCTCRHTQNLGSLSLSVTIWAVELVIMKEFGVISPPLPPRLVPTNGLPKPLFMLTTPAPKTRA